MRQSELKLWMAVQDAAENKVAGRDGGVEREAEEVREIERRGTRSANDLQRMQENGKIQGLNVGKNWLKQRVVEIAMVDVRAHVNARQPFRVTKRSTKLRRSSNTTRRSRVHVQTVGL